MATSNYLFSLILVALIQGFCCDKVNINPQYKLVQPGDSVTVMCKVNSKIQYCRFQFNGEMILNLGPNKPGTTIKYSGNGFDRGECGAVLTHAEDKHNGLVICTIGFEEDTAEVNGTMTLVIARTPSPPDLQLHKKQDYFKEGEKLDATCTVEKGRPVSNLTWYLGNTVIYEGLSHEVLTVKEDLHTIRENISHVVEASDDGKELKCVADHPGLKRNFSIIVIRVKYQPKSLPDPIEHFGLVEGAQGRIGVVVTANPQPKFIWSVGDKVLNEEDVDGRFSVLKATNMMNGSWESVLLIDSLTKDDVEQQYTLTASNDIGETTYKVLISTSPRPKVLEIGTGLIIFIILAILVLIIIGVAVLYARSRGVWCFSGMEGLPRLTAGCSDMEFGEQHNSEISAKGGFAFVYKKPTDKAANLNGLHDDSFDEEIVPDVPIAVPDSPLDPDEGVVYAELDLTPRRSGTTPVIRIDEEKTEYAEIIHTQSM